MERTYEELLEVFRAIGVKEPELWARSWVRRPSSGVARFLFQHHAWTHCICDDGDTSWIDAQRRHAEAHPEAPCSGAGPALDRLLARGVDRLDLTEVVRVMQYETLYYLCCLLDGTVSVEPASDVVAWALVELDSEGRPLGAMDSLHESVLGMDPTGREMGPRKRNESETGSDA